MNTATKEDMSRVVTGSCGSAKPAPASGASSLAFMSVSLHGASALRLFTLGFSSRGRKPSGCTAYCGTRSGKIEGFLTRWLRTLSQSGANCCA